MSFSSATKLCLLLALSGMVAESVAEDLPVSQSDLVATLQQTKTVDRIDDLARLTWAMLETIDREHFHPPKREELLQAVAAFLIEPEVNETRAVDKPGMGLQRDQRVAIADRPDTEPITQRLLECQNVDTFALVFRDIWVEFQKNGLLSEKIIGDLANNLQEAGGLQSLVSTNEEAIHEQFRTNRYVGLGVTAGQTGDRELTFTSILPGGPADRAGLKAQTEVIEIDGHSTKDQDLLKVIDRIRGPAGTEVMLTIRDPDRSETRRIGIKRGLVRFDSLFDRSNNPISRVQSLERVQQKSIGWISFREISSSTASELREAEAKARAQELRVMIFDFRTFSRGNNLYQAKLVADSLIDGGILWSSLNRKGDVEVEMADRECLFRNIPLVILLSANSGESPAHCAIAAALQDAGRATIVGSTVFGGQVGTVIPVPGFPYSMYLNTHKIIRAKLDAGWPMRPDHLVDDPRQRFLQQQQTRSGPVSALAPANTSLFWQSLDGWVGPQELEVAALNGQLKPEKRVQTDIRNAGVPLRKILERSQDTVAIRVATEILNLQPQRQP